MKTSQKQHSSSVLDRCHVGSWWCRCRWCCCAFIASWNPSAKAKAGADVEVDISGIEPGQLVRVMWRSKPVWIVRRTPEILEELGAHEDKLKDPNSEAEQQPAFAQNRFRSMKEEYLILVGICTHLGCSPQHLKDGAFEEVVEGVPDGFFYRATVRNSTWPLTFLHR